MSTCRRLCQSLHFLVGALLILNLVACAQNPVSGKNDFVMMSEDSEVKIGRTNHPKIIAEYGLYDDDVLQRYVQSVGHRLADISHRKGLVYHFTVLDSPVINAFALPGGYIYITRGLMAYLNSEAELAAVLGHEIGHVTARHGVRQQSAAQAANIGYTIGAILVPELLGGSSQDLFNMFGGALLSGYGREHELESDGLGAEYLARAGYDPKAMLDVIRVLKNQASFAEMEAKHQGIEPRAYHGVFASHPDNDTRLKRVVEAANQYAVPNALVKRDAYLAQINGLAFGDSAKHGVRYKQNFYHHDMGFSVEFPVDWQVNNRPDRVQSIAVDGQAFIELTAVDLNRRLSPAHFMKQRLGVERLKAGQALNTNGLEGYTGIVDAQDGGWIRISLLYLEQKVYVFIAGTQQKQAFNQFDASFLATAKSFHRLRGDEIALAQGQKLMVKNIGQGDSYQAWSKKSPISNSPLLQLRLLNAQYPSGELRWGQKAKMIR
ncbi:MAG: putative Zn-dependent protease [Methylophagaceae bacterium]|jgi:predicted Zn-dependent protease